MGNLNYKLEYEQLKKEFELSKNQAIIRFAEKIKEELILSRKKYGVDWCDTLFLKHIDKIQMEMKE